MDRKDKNWVAQQIESWCKDQNVPMVERGALKWGLEKGIEYGLNNGPVHDIALQSDVDQDRRRRVFEQVALRCVSEGINDGNWFIQCCLPHVSEIAEAILSEGKKFAENNEE